MTFDGLQYCSRSIVANGFLLQTVSPEPSCTMIKTKDEPEPEDDTSFERWTAAVGVSATIAVVALNQGMEFAFADIINSFFL